MRFLIRVHAEILDQVDAPVLAGEADDRFDRAVLSQAELRGGECAHHLVHLKTLCPQVSCGSSTTTGLAAGPEKTSTPASLSAQAGDAARLRSNSQPEAGILQGIIVRFDPLDHLAAALHAAGAWAGRR